MTSVSTEVEREPALEQSKRRPLASPWRRPRGATLLVGVMALALIATISLAQGSVSIPVPTIVGILLAKLPFLGDANISPPPWPSGYEAVIVDIRLPRLLLAGLVGAALSVSGASYQGLFRNPLADPYLIGVSAGAALGAVSAIVLPLPPVLYQVGAVQVAAFVGAVFTVAVVYSVGRVGKTTPVTTLLLAGVAMGALAAAITSFLMYINGDKLLPIYSWLLGGVTLSSWQQLITTLPYMALGSAVLLLCARPLNIMQLDEEQAAQLGIAVERWKLVLVVAATLTAAAAVSVSGLIAFVGLIVPHTVRLIWGPDYRFLLPMSLLGGAAFLILADSLARVILAPGELPVGVITAICGAPFFLYLLRQKKRMVF